MELIKVKALAGCLGCYYENETICPADNGTKIHDFSVCTDEENAVIFVPSIQQNKGENDCDVNTK